MHMPTLHHFLASMNLSIEKFLTTIQVNFNYKFFLSKHLKSNLDNATGASADMLELAINHRRNLSGVLKISTAEASEGELAAMVSFAIAFPNGFMALVDTYDTKRLNFIAFSAFKILS